MIAVIILCLICFAAPGFAEEESGRRGYWLTEARDAVIHIHPCSEGDKTLCGHLVWVHPEKDQIDYEHPDPEKRERNLCGIKVLWNLTPVSPAAGTWRGGKMYHPSHGSFYKLRIRQESQASFNLRAFVGVPLFGRTITFSRVDPDDYDTCPISKNS